MTSRAFALLIAVTMFSPLAVPASSASPSLTSIAPGTGSTNGGTVLTLAGSNLLVGAMVQFRTTLSTPTVRVVTLTATSIHFDGGSILATTPAAPAGFAGSADVVLTNPDGTQIVSSGGFTYQPAPAPALASIVPTFGSAQGTGPQGSSAVVLTGSGFSTGIAPEVDFTIGGTSVKATVLQPLSSTQILVLAPGRGSFPPGSSNAADIKVQNPDGSSNGLSKVYTYIAQPAPTITGLAPISGSTNGGTALTLTGTGFAPGVNVTFQTSDGAASAPAASVVYTSPTQLQLVAPSIQDSTPPLPSGPGKTLDLKITNPDGSVVVAQHTFTFAKDSPPLLVSVNPANGPSVGGTLLSISGTGFSNGPRLSVAINGINSPAVTFLSPSLLTAVAPPCNGSCLGQVQITVTNPDGQSYTAPSIFTYIPVMRIDGIAAPSASAAQGSITLRGDGSLSPSGTSPTSVGLSGTALPSPCRVLVGHVDVPNPNCSDKLITFTAPPALPGTYDVQVVAVGGEGRSAILQGGISYVAAPAPVLTALNPTSSDSNAATGSGPVFATLTGPIYTLEQDSTGAVVFPKVNFGTVAAIVCSATNQPIQGCTAPAPGSTLYVVVPPYTQGTFPATVPVTIQNRDLQQMQGTPPKYTYSKATTPTFLACGSGCPTGQTPGGTPATYTGTGFVVGTRVRFGSGGPEIATTGTCPTTINCVSSDGQSVTVLAPASNSGAASTVDVTITNPDGQASTSGTYSFSYSATQPPAISGVVALNPPLTTIGGLVTISNRGTPFVFGPRLAVSVDGVTMQACSTLVSITCIAPTAIHSGGNTLDVVVPGHARGTASLTVTNADGQTSTLPAALSYSQAAAPTLTSIVPPRGVAGTIATLTGNNLALPPNTQPPMITIGGIAAVVCLDATTAKGCLPPNSSSQLISFVVPATSPTGAQAIVLTNPDGVSGQLTGNAFRILALPSQVSMSPNSDTINGGTTVTFTGTGFTPFLPPLALFGNPSGTPPLTLGGGFNSTTATTATAVVPAVGTTGSTSVYLVDRDGQALTFTSAFTYNAALPPSFTSVTPSLASVNGHAQIAIAGVGFATGASLCIRPAGSTPLPDSTTSPTPCIPAVLGGSPAQAAGLVTGAVVAQSTTGSTGGLSTITFVAPGHAAGPVDIVISNPSAATNPSGSAATLVLPAKESRFAYAQVAGPAISSLSPTTGDAAGGTAVTLKGFNFAGGATVTFNGTAATAVTVVDSNTITATTPPGSGAVTVTVTISGLPASLQNGFTYISHSSTNGTSTSPTGAPSSTSTGTGSLLPPPSALTSDQIISANKAIQVTVTRDGNDNVVSFVLPNNMPASPAGVQVWRSNSPYVLLETLSSDSPAFAARIYRDVGAPISSTYKVTVYYGNGQGKATTGMADVPGFDQVPGIQSDAVQQSFYTKLAYGIGLGLLAIIIVVLVVTLVRRRNRGTQPAYTGSDMGYVAPADGETPAPEAAPPAGPVHNINCPVCKASFEAVGEKPLRMKCPNCGREGILR